MPTLDLISHLVPDGGSTRPLLPEASARPVGKGYRDIVGFLAPYFAAARSGASATPTLAASLRSLLPQALIAAHLRRLPSAVACLLQGYSTPGNADALRDFLGAHGVRSPRIWAVDLYDLRAVYRALRMPPPQMEFAVADAAALGALFPDGAFDVIVQDFLLNCLPLGRHGPLLEETARLLAPTGCALIHFTDSTGVRQLRRWSAEELAERHGLAWDAAAYQLSDMISSAAGETALRARLGGTVVTTNWPDQFTYVAPENGQLEFFPASARVFSLLRDAGLETVYAHYGQGVDNHGLRCHRHRCLVRKRPGAS